MKNPVLSMTSLKKAEKQACSVLLALCMLVVFFCSSAAAESAATGSTVTVSLNTRFGQTEARSMLSMVNAFRTGSEAWYWKEDNQTKFEASDLDPLTYDYSLEKVAMQRAAEVAVWFGHQRPKDGSSYAYGMLKSTWTYWGENIAAGYSTAQAAFDAWKEDRDKFEGQGHRRAMLRGEFTAVGIAHLKYNGVDYWVQEFASPVTDTTPTAANDADTVMKVEISSALIRSRTVTCSRSAVSMKPGDSLALPTVTQSLTMADTASGRHYPGKTIPIRTDVHWTVGNSGIAAIRNGKLYARKAGKTTLSTPAALAGGGTLTLTVTVQNPGDYVSSCKGLDVRKSGDRWCTFKGTKKVIYTGVAQNKYGWWYCRSGSVDFSFSGVASNDYGTWKIKNGKADFGADGLAKAGNGWYLFDGGKVQTRTTGLFQNQYGWWYVRNGAVDFSYCGIAANKYGKWYVRNGQVQFSFTGKVTFSGHTYTVKDGKVTG